MPMGAGAEILSLRTGGLRAGSSACTAAQDKRQRRGLLGPGVAMRSWLATRTREICLVGNSAEACSVRVVMCLCAASTGGLICTSRVRPSRCACSLPLALQSCLRRLDLYATPSLPSSSDITCSLFVAARPVPVHGHDTPRPRHAPATPSFELGAGKTADRGPPGKNSKTTDRGAKPITVFVHIAPHGRARPKRGRLAMGRRGEEAQWSEYRCMNATSLRQFDRSQAAQPNT